ncbi:Lysophospholipase L1 [Nocardioides terrae]|uniref:Lysophospholipase L1 n=1 Tax=Nocardioides terrae TaxID=574651 RepID=A0A1I1EWN3_9ACTN|nr:SGNH/GDSL hydrolase family protein [Nocardioides terrae]SFB91126.1 Lysophospholipase L1 [Nocardioides terrae]
MAARSFTALVLGGLLALPLSACGASSDGGGAAAPAPAASSGASSGVSSAPSSAASSAASSGASPGASPAASPAAAEVSAGAAAGRFGRYVALGDSYTAAPGIPGRTSDDGCLRSDRNYPHLLAAALGARLTDVSCGGASTADVRRAQLRGVRPQLDAVTADTDLVTIGLGGNDLNLFGSLIGACVRPDAASVPGTPCADALGSKVAPTLDRMEQRLVGVVRAVRHRAPSAKVLLVGYPQIIPASGRCADVPFAAGDYRFARRVNHGLTQAVRHVAVDSRVTYVDLWAASAGHDVCSADPWINGLSGQGAAPFHPFAVEQVAVAQEVATALS